MAQKKTTRSNRTYRVSDIAYLKAKEIAKPTLTNVIEDVVEAIAEGRKITISKKPSKIS